VRRFHPFATPNVSDPNDALGHEVRRQSNLRRLSDAHSFFLRSPKEREIDPFAQGLGSQRPAIGGEAHRVRAGGWLAR
jgi:hypothetical protein